LHGLVLSTSGKVYAFGAGTFGQLGNAMDISRTAIAPVPSTELFKKIACGGHSNLALTASGDLYAWGLNTQQWLGVCDPKHNPLKPWMSVPSQIAWSKERTKKPKMIACGSHHYAVITEAGALYTWGCGKHGRLGHGEDTDITEPKLVEFFESLGTKVRDVALGVAHTVVVLDNDDVYTFGCGMFGRLGHGREADEFLPRRVEKLKEVIQVSIRRIAAGGSHTAIATDDGQVWTWGLNDFGQLGVSLKSDGPNFSMRPVRVDGVGSVSRIACGENHSLLLVNALRSTTAAAPSPTKKQSSFMSESDKSAATSNVLSKLGSRQ
jgi:alpha-tubulin suppressor-like RCC1 family protein